MSVSSAVLQARGCVFGTGSPYGLQMQIVQETRSVGDTIVPSCNAVSEYGTGGPEAHAMAKASKGTTVKIQAAYLVAQVFGTGSPEYRAMATVKQS